MPTERLQSEVTVGSPVYVPCVVTAIGGTTTNPTVTLVTKHKGFDGNTDVVGPVDAIQVVLDQ